MNTHSPLIAPHVQAFFAEHLTQHKRVSPQTLASMRMNRAAFGLPCELRGLSTPCGIYGNFGSNNISGPGTQVFDLSLFKTTNITERVRLQLRAEFFNALNRANFQAPSGARLRISDVTFGRVTAADLPREIQFALKLLF